MHFKTTSIDPYIPEISRILVHRRLVQTSDNNGSNVMYEPTTHRLYSVDFNFSPKANGYFLKSGFTAHILRACRDYIRDNHAEMSVFVKRVQDLGIDFVDKSFCL